MSGNAFNAYSGNSKLAAVLRASAVGVGLIYGSIKLKSIQRTAAKNRAAKEAEHH